MGIAVEDVLFEQGALGFQSAQDSNHIIVCIAAFDGHSDTACETRKRPDIADGCLERDGGTEDSAQSMVGRIGYPYFCKMAINSRMQSADER